MYGANRPPYVASVIKTVTSTKRFISRVLRRLVRVE